jgi:hypothetical protein
MNRVGVFTFLFRHVFALNLLQRLTRINKRNLTLLSA